MADAMTHDRYLGSMLGAALGDALGRPTEFDGTPNGGIVDWATLDLPSPAEVTDDTEMALVVAEALPGPVVRVESRLVEGLRWWNATHDPERAPGSTCLRSTWRLTRGYPWWRATDAASKGCGGVMRAHPCAFVADDEHADLIGLVQSAMTHGHPTAHVSARAWVAAVRAASRGVSPDQWLLVALDAAGRDAPAMIPPLVRNDWRLGQRETAAAIAEAANARGTWDEADDPCDITGDGWTAEEAVATALLIAVRFADRPVDALRRAASTCGDSDTIASMVGAILGAAHGTAAWPTGWVSDLEELFATRIHSLTLPEITGSIHVPSAGRSHP